VEKASAWFIGWGKENSVNFPSGKTRKRRNINNEEHHSFQESRTRVPAARGNGPCHNMKKGKLRARILVKKRTFQPPGSGDVVTPRKGSGEKEESRKRVSPQQNIKLLRRGNIS